MQTYIALLRGINVGGHKKVPMAELRELLSRCGFQDVKTYIQSGNVIFQSSERDYLNIEQTIKEAILSHFGFEVSVLVRKRADLERIFNTCPFPEEKKQASYFAILQTSPNVNLVKEASEKIYEGEEYFIINDCIYFYCEKGYGKAKFNLNFFEKKLRTCATSRNYKTMVKLLSLSTES